MTRTDQDIRSEERGIYLVIFGAMIPIVLITALTRGVFDGGATICLILAVISTVGLVATLVMNYRDRPELPRAHTHDQP